MKKKKKEIKRETKKPYCFTLLPSTMDKVEKEASKHEGRSASLQVDIILRAHYDKK